MTKENDNKYPEFFGGEYNEADPETRQVLALLKNLSRAKDRILPNRDLYHKILRRGAVDNRMAGRYLSSGGKKGRNLLINFNNFFMTFNWKVITAVCLVMVLGGVFAYWQLTPRNVPTSGSPASTEDVDLSEYSPATVVAIKDVNMVVDSVISESEAELDALIEEEMDIYLADAEAQALSDLEQLYEAYEL
jgi:hypothetical protein